MSLIPSSPSSPTRNRRIRQDIAVLVMAPHLPGCLHQRQRPNPSRPGGIHLRSHRRSPLLLDLARLRLLRVYLT